MRAGGKFGRNFLQAKIFTYRTSNTTHVKKIISILKNARFSGKGRQSLLYKRYENS